ncbi:MAG: glycosyltransferase [Alphaproteobacteria bacterium]|nr:glycosyltransferase [Alphaproteobacteria bacterium]MDE2110129.1 glycosyltransferase [Alphaproteobacteria bacterium]
MKIVDISEFYSPTGGGVRNYVDQKFKAAAKHRHSLTVIAPGKEDRVEAREGGKLVWLETPQLPFDRNYHMFWRAEDVWRVLDEEAPDVVEGSSPWRGGWIAARWQGSAVKMLFMHADPVAVYPQTLLAGMMAPSTIDRLFGWYWSYLRRLSTSFDGCVVAGPWLATRFANYGLRNLHVVPFGVDRASFRADLRDEALRSAMLEECGLAPDAALLINIGRHHPEKRVGTAIDAVSQAQKTRPVGLYIVGDGLIHARVKAKAARSSHIHVAGWLNDRAKLARMIASADALLHCSTAETYGFVVAEALCCGIPVIVPNAGGAGDLAASEYAGIYAPGDSNSAAKAILDLLGRNQATLSNNALDAARRRIGSIESHFEELFAVYAQAVHRKSIEPAASNERCVVSYESV